MGDQRPQDIAIPKPETLNLNPTQNPDVEPHFQHVSSTLLLLSNECHHCLKDNWMVRCCYTVKGQDIFF
jgi:hypothetical protein